MNDPSNRTVSLNLTDDEFLRLHATASAEGVEVNDFIVATLRRHARIEADLEIQQLDADPDPATEI